MKNFNRPTSDAILKVLQQAGISWYHLYREPRKTAKFIDGYSFKLYGCRSDPVMLERLLERNGLVGLHVRRTQPWGNRCPGIAITW